jgi:hypothetical protein
MKLKIKFAVNALFIGLSAFAQWNQSANGPSKFGQTDANGLNAN